jgi:mannose-6-phosphate isomerase
MSVRRMVNPIQEYAWGSREGIAGLQRRPRSERPEAELWMGAHPHAPSLLEPDDGTEPGTLGALIAADPVGALGASCVHAFGARLPYLLKVLAADQPLSLQVHPDADRARLGFDAENEAGIDPGAAHRVFRDPYAKPELLVALTEFQLLHGFRHAAVAAEALSALGVNRLVDVVAALRAGEPTGEVFLHLIGWPQADRAALVRDVKDAVTAAPSDATSPWLLALAERYPDDPGVVGVLLLNYLAIQPGQGVYVRPGQIHSYLHGTGIEILGGSDNVIRCGLTSKHVSPTELRSTLSVAPIEPAIIRPVAGADGGETWPTPQPEFELTRLTLDHQSRALSRRGPSIFLCIEGKVEITCCDTAVTLAPGDSAFVAADATELAASGSGVLLRAHPQSAADPTVRAGVHG